MFLSSGSCCDSMYLSEIVRLRHGEVCKSSLLGCQAANSPEFLHIMCGVLWRTDEDSMLLHQSGVPYTGPVIQ